jgi:replicative DNA helicase
MKLLNPEAETLLLSTAMRHTARVIAHCVEAVLTRDAFADPANGWLYSYLLGVWGEGRPVERFRMVQDLREYGLVEACGGLDRIHALFLEPALESAAPDYIDAIKDCALRRRILKTTGKAHADVQGEVSTDAILTDLRASLDATNQTSPVEMPTAKQLTAEINEGAGNANVAHTGFASIDEICGGVRRGDMLVIAGQAKAGKSTLAANIARNVARSGFVAVFTIEMNRSQCWKRMLCAEAAVPTSYFTRNGTPLQHEKQRMDSASEKMAALPITIVDRVTDIDQAIALCAMLKQKHGRLAAVVFDYLQLFSCEALKGASSTALVAGISSRIKRAATSLQTLAIVPCQLNDDGRALDSRAAERDCDLMLTIVSDNGGKRTVFVGYNRNGVMNIPLEIRAELQFNRFREGAR